MKRFALLIPVLLVVITIFVPTAAASARISSDSGPAAIATRVATATLSVAIPQADTTTPTTLRATAVPAQIAQFPIPADAVVIPNAYSRDTTIFTTSLSFAEVVDFYRTTLTTNGATERSYLTFIEQEEGWFSVVFDGWTGANGKTVVIQGVNFPGGTTTASIRLERVN